VARRVYTPAAAAAPERVAEILRVVGAQLERQRAKGNRFFIDDRLSDLDIYWATFAAMLQPLPPDLCAMSAMFRAAYTTTGPVIRAATAPSMLEHRNFIYRDYLETPIDL